MVRQPLTLWGNSSPRSPTHRLVRERQALPFWKPTPAPPAMVWPPLEAGKSGGGVTQTHCMCPINVDFKVPTALPSLRAEARGRPPSRDLPPPTPTPPVPGALPEGRERGLRHLLSTCCARPSPLSPTELLTEVKATVPTDKLEGVHQLPAAQGLTGAVSSKAARGEGQESE